MALTGHCQTPSGSPRPYRTLCICVQTIRFRPFAEPIILIDKQATAM